VTFGVCVCAVCGVSKGGGRDRDDEVDRPKKRKEGGGKNSVRGSRAAKEEAERKAHEVCVVIVCVCVCVCVCVRACVCVRDVRLLA
jgi:hypothetical protein